MTDLTFLFQNTPVTLERLHKEGRKTAIVSTKFRCRIEKILKKEAVLQYIDLIIGGEDVKKHKPDAEGLL